MLRLKFFIALVLAMSLAQAQPPDAQKVAAAEQIFASTKPEAMFDQVFTQMRTMMHQQAQALLSKQLPPSADHAEVVQDVNEFSDHVIERMSHEVTVAKLKPIVVQIYVDEFTLDELQGIAAFYKTPAGRALVSKLPTITAKTMQAAQPLVQDFLPELQQMTIEWAAKMKQKYSQ